MFKSTLPLLRRSFSTTGNVHTYRVINGRPEGVFFKWVSEKSGREHNVDSPLEALLGALAACEEITANFWAKKMGIDFRGLQFPRIEADLDTKSFVGDGVPAKFSEVRIEVHVKTSEGDEVVEELKKNVQEHCPVFNMIKQSGVEIKSNWKKEEIENCS